MNRVIHWFRRDLRVTDNTALSAAARRAKHVIPVFIQEEAIRTGPDVGAARLAFLLGSLDVLRRQLEHLGYSLVIRHGKSEVELPALCRELKVEAVFCNRRYEPYATARDNRVFNALNAMGVGFEAFKDAVIWEEQEIVTGAGTPYTVFTPYARAWSARKSPAPQQNLAPAHGRALRPRSDAVPLAPADLGHRLTQTIPPAGEQAASDLLERFLSGPVFEYERRRDFPAREGTSRLSAHLRCGTIGIRTVMARLAAARARGTRSQRPSCDVFLKELIWREFYLQILSNFPHVMKGSFRPEYDRLQWSENQGHFRAWSAGETGYPIVDAAMRCLNATGWMHNRLRMITAMFLTKDLRISWQRGERYFMQQLVDGDLAANNGGWQWSAGTGTDAAPYFRIFNPVTQSKNFDPEGEFVRQWIPELANLPSGVIHEPWRAKLKPHYPDRVVVHEEQRKECLAMYEAVKRGPAGRSRGRA